MKRILTLVTALVLACLLCVTAFAAGYNSDVGLDVSLDTDSFMTSSSEKDITITVKTTKEVDLFSIGYTVDLPAGWTIKTIASGMTGVDYSDFSSTETGIVSWYKGSNVKTSVIGVITITVPANTAAGEYKVGVKGVELATSDANDDNAWMENGAKTATLTITPDPNKHTHVAAAEWTTDGTGHWHACTAVAGCKEKLDYAAHSSTGNNAATCTTAAKCDVCEVSYGTALGHKWTAATCTAPKTCSVCNATEGNALGHDWKAATCTEPKTCNRCKVKEGEALGHQWDKGVVTLLPTIEKDGVKTFTCSVCKATKTEAVPKLDSKDTDQSAANDVINKINAIGKVTTKSGDAIKAAREAYDKLTDAQKELAKGALSVLEAAEKEYARLTAAPDHSGRNYPAKGGSTTTTKDGKTVESGKTFDAGIALYVGLSVLSVTGGALVIGKKKEF